MQERLFELIAVQYSDPKELRAALTEILGKSDSTIYRQMTNKVSLSLRDFESLAASHGLGCYLFDRSGKHVSTKQDLRLRDINPTAIREYLRALSSDYMAASDEEYHPILFFAKDIPLVHVLAFPELLCFRLYDWADSNELYVGSYEQFADRYMGFCRDIASSGAGTCYTGQGATEIWHAHTLLPTLQSIQYYYRRRDITDPSVMLALRQAMLQMLGRLEEWLSEAPVLTGRRTFRLYESYTELPAHMASYRHGNGVRHVFALHPFMHHIDEGLSADEQQLEIWSRSLFKRCYNLNQSSDIERVAFFGRMKQQVETHIMGLLGTAVG